VDWQGHRASSRQRINQRAAAPTGNETRSVSGKSHPRTGGQLVVVPRTVRGTTTAAVIPISRTG
jgi:hypothetical protein